MTSKYITSITSTLFLTAALAFGQALAGGGSTPAPATSKPAVSKPTSTISALISGDPSYSTLLKALKKAGLVETLASGNYTVFAPNNVAFAKLPAAKLTALLNDREQLRAVLLNHVVAGKRSAKRVAALKEVNSVGGNSLKIMLHGSRVMVGNAHITKVNWAASNGVIHVVDAVILPAEKMVVKIEPAPPSQSASPTQSAQPSRPIPSTPASTTPNQTAHARNMVIRAPARPTEPAAEPATTANSLVAVVAQNPELSTLATVIKEAELADVLNGVGPFTLLAPSNAAFTLMGDEELKAMLADKEKLRKILLNHVINGSVNSQAIIKLSDAKTAAGSELMIIVAGETVSIDGSFVSAVDLPAGNGVIHIIDSVIMPYDAE